MPNLKPFRDYSEHDVINLLSCDVIATKGTIVKPKKQFNKNPLELTNTAPGAQYENTISNLFNIVGSVEPVVNYDDTPIPLGVLLYDVKEKDENGEKLIFNPRKAAEMNIVLPKINTAPILTKGLIMINDIDTSSHVSGGGEPDLGDIAYVGNDGKIATDGIIKIGRFLSTKDQDGYCLVRIDFN